MKRTLALLAFAGLAAGVAHFAGRQKARRRPAQVTDDAILERVRSEVPASIDVRVRDGIVALRGRASVAERERALAYTLSIPGVRRVYSDFETDTPTMQTGAAKVGIVHPRS